MSRQVFSDKCRHFNGIQHDCCRAGVRYKDVEFPEGKAFQRLPCLEHHATPPDTCPKRSFLTQEEHAAHEAEVRAAIDKALADIAAGKCHVCGAPAEPSTVVGRCRYAACGHRVGQVADPDDHYP